MATKTPPIPERSAAPTQLSLVEERSEPSWHLDPATREIGRRGVEQARAVLRASRPRFLDAAA